MRKFNGLVAVSALAVIVGGVSAPAMADTITNAINFSLTNGTFIYTPPAPVAGAVGTYTSLSSLGTVAQFDSSLGQLNSVTITINLGFHASDTASKANNNGAITNGNLTQQVSAAVTSPDNFTVTDGNTQQFNMAGGSQIQSVPVTFGSAAAPLTNTGFSVYTVASQPAFTSTFVGGGNTAVNVNLTPSAIIDQGYLSGSNVTLDQLSGTVTYNFSPTPAPPGVVSGLIGIAMGGAQFGVMKFRRRRAKKTEATEVAA